MTSKKRGKKQNKRVGTPTKKKVGGSTTVKRTDDHRRSFGHFKTNDGIRLAVDRREFDGEIQVCIERIKTGTGFRLLGPKYDGRGARLASKVLTKSDADEIRSYLEELDMWTEP